MALVDHPTVGHRHPLSGEAQSWQQEARRNGKPSARVCVVCKDVILDPDDYVGTGMLTRDISNPIYAFNFIYLHRSHISRGPRWRELIRLLEEARAAGSWQGPRLHESGEVTSET
jgi:hypothetical protein